jgi:polysaccharide deacetylase 2 family uncharacterized protein YibQ
MPRTAAGGTDSGRKRWGWGALIAGAFLAGLLLVGVVLLRTPETERPRGETSPVPPPASSTPGAGDDVPAGTPKEPPSPRIAIVVDDLGYEPVRDAEWLDFPDRITFSVLPYGPSSKSIAASARTRGFGVILHVPMEPEGPASDRTESFLLRRGMTTAEIAERFARMAADVPQANGASNHMGSAFTSDPAAMAAFAQALKGKGFFFVDSVTSSGTVGLRAAAAGGVPATRRDVFLDDDGRPEEMRRRWEEAIALARERGSVVLMCHARRETRRILNELLPDLRKEGIRAVTVEELIMAQDTLSRSGGHSSPSPR